MKYLKLKIFSLTILKTLVKKLVWNYEIVLEHQPNAHITSQLTLFGSRPLLTGMFYFI